jgi:hypothetical protein
MTWNGAMFVECALCTDGAPAMLGSKSGFQTLIKQKAPDAKGLHCMIHRYALASKTLPESFTEVLNGVIKVDNHIKSSALNSRLFKEFCQEVGADYEGLLYYTAVRWLSNGNVMSRCHDL